MHVAEVKRSTTSAQQVQAKREPFFSKEGEGRFFSKSNEATRSFFGPTHIQPKLTIGQPDDQYEKEADSVADRVVQKLSEPESQTERSRSLTEGATLNQNTLQTKCASCEEEEKLQKKEKPLMAGITGIQRKPIFESNAENPEGEVQRKSEQHSSDFPSTVMGKLTGSKGNGTRLEPRVQQSMGSGFGADFSGVRIHTGSHAVQMARDLNAQAFTHGSDIYFNQGKYDPGSASGKHLLAHELTHTVQQGAVQTGVQRVEQDRENSTSDRQLNTPRPISGVAIQKKANGIPINGRNTSANSVLGPYPFVHQAPAIQAKCAECEKQEDSGEGKLQKVQMKLMAAAADDVPDPNNPNIQRRALEMEKTDYPIMFRKMPNLQLSGSTGSPEGSREAIVAEAQKMVGKIEAKKDDGSGRRVGAKHLLEIFHLAAKDAWPDQVIETAGKEGFPHWCGIFTVYAIKKAGIDLGYWQVGKGVSSFGTLQATENPLPGDIGYFELHQHHCIIKAVHGDTIDTIDGNSGNFSEVKEKTRPRSQFLAFFTPFTGVEKFIQKKAEHSPDTSTGTDGLQDQLTARSGQGAPLPTETRSQMESGFGTDFSGVNIHKDSKAAELSNDLGAQAFTHGNDIYFNQGKYNPESASGKHLLAHELTHTVQQGASIQSKMVQCNGNNNSGNTDKNVIPKGPPYVIKGNKIDPTVNPKTLNIGKISLPDFKQRNEVKFKLPLQSVQPRPEGTKQEQNWKNSIRSAIDSKVAAKLEKVSKTAQGLYFLTSKNSNFRIFGSLRQIQEESYIPKWNRFGASNLHQVDHILEMQLGGADDISNYELTDNLANTSSGNSIKFERYRRMDSALAEFQKLKVPDVPKREVVNNEYIVSYHKIENWSLPYQGNGKVYWTKKEIDEGRHLDQLRPMTAAEIATSQGSTEELAIYVYENAGKPLKIKLPFAGSQSNWLPGIDLVSLTHNANAVDGKEFGTIGIELRSDFSDKLKSGAPFTISFNKSPGLNNTGYLTFTKAQQGLSGQLRFIGLSPIEIDRFSLDEKKGIILNGKIKTDIPIFKGAAIDFSVEGSNYTLSKTFTLGEVPKKILSPFDVTDISLLLFASTSRGFGIEGSLGLKLGNIGKGTLNGIGSSQKGFGIRGDFEFDPELFKSKISVSYINNIFSFDGHVSLEKSKLKGVESLDLDVSYAQETIQGKGLAKLSIPGIKQVGIKVDANPQEGLIITGDIEFGNLDKFKASGAKVQLIISNKGTGWKIDIVGDLKPNIDVAGLKIKEVNISFIEGIFDVSANAEYKKGKISGDINAGITNAIILPDSTKGKTPGKGLIFYATGTLKLEIIKDVGVVLKVSIKEDGDLLIGGKLDLKKDKYLIDPKVADSKSDSRLKIWEFSKSIPVASCGVASLVIGLKGGIGLFYIFEGLKINKESEVNLEEVSLKDLSKVRLTSKIIISTGIKAGVDAYLGASAGLQVLIAGVRGSGTVNLKLTAIEAKAKADVAADFSAEKGLEFKEAGLDFDVASKIAIEVILGIAVYLDLLFTDITLWSHDWKPEALKGERAFKWFDGSIHVPLKFGQNNAITLDNITDGLKSEMGSKAKDESLYERGAKKGINDEGPTQEEKNEESKQNIKKQVKEAYRGSHSAAVFSFNQSIDPLYFEQRKDAWFRIDVWANLDPVTKENLQTEIRKYEFEEYEAFGSYLSSEKYFDSGTKHILIDEFVFYRPTLGETERVNLKSLVPTSNSIKGNGGRKNKR